MAAAKESTGGFSYAQAAKSRPFAAPSAAQSSKATSGVVTPATGSVAERAPGSSWADDVEANVVAAPQKQSQEQITESEKQEAVPSLKIDEQSQSGTPAITSPEIGTTSGSTSNHDDASSVPNASSSESTWESKSQASEPAWIADREKRQGSSFHSEETAKVEEKPKEAPPPKPQLQDAPPPTVNVWAARAQALKSKVVAQPLPAKARASIAAPEATPSKENPRPKAGEPRKKANSINGLPREAEYQSNATGKDTGKPDSFQGKRSDENRINHGRQASKPNGDTPVEGTRRIQPRPRNDQRQSLPSAATAPPSVHDEISWPTPDSAQEKERKRAQEKETQEKKEEGAAPSAKPHAKPEWKPVPYVPNVIFESHNDIRGAKPPGSTRGGGRGGSSARGRGAFHGPNGGPPNGVDENSASFRRGRPDIDREAMPPPAKPNRASSAGSPRDQRNTDQQADRSVRGGSMTESAVGVQIVTDMATAQPGRNGPSQSRTHTKHYSKMSESASPENMELSGIDTKGEDKIPEPIPRRSSIGTQTEDISAGADTNTRDGPPIRMVPSESRKESRSFDNYRDPNWNGAQYRGKPRGGRGRGGAREFANGHSGHAYSNGHSADFSTAPPYGVPPSPSAYHSQRGNHSAYQQQGRSNWRGAGPRASSIPMDGYGRYAGTFTGQPHLPPMHTYVPGMYENYAYPMSAMPYPSFVEQPVIMDLVSTQLEYYFSLDNLLKDLFLRSNMDSQGFVFLSVIAGFNRIKHLCNDLDVIREVCLRSENIEIRVGDDGKERLRKREGWEQFVLPMDRREVAAQTDGPAHLERPQRPQLQMFSPQQQQPRGPASAGVPPTYGRPDRRSADVGYMMSGVTPQAFFPSMPESAYGEMLNGEEIRGRQTKSPIHDGVVSPTDATVNGSPEDQSNEEDAFPNQQIAALTVIVKSHVEPAQRAPYHTAASRTFSNGSIDSRSIFDEIQRFDEQNSRPVTNGDAGPNGLVQPL